MIIDEKAMLGMLDTAKKVCLLEPYLRYGEQLPPPSGLHFFKRRPPVGLMKIAGRVVRSGGEYVYAVSPLDRKSFECDLVCMTTLFSYHLPIVADVIGETREVWPRVPILVGGLAASHVPRFLDGSDVYIFTGYSAALDDEIPHYGEEYFRSDQCRVVTSRISNRSFAHYTSAGAERAWVNPNWKEWLRPHHKHLRLLDTALLASPPKHVLDVIRTAKDRGMTLHMGGAIDPRDVTDETLPLLAEATAVCPRLYLMLDAPEQEEDFELAVKRLLDVGVPKPSLSVFLLYAYKEEPDDAERRARRINALGLRIRPRAYVPLDWTSLHRDFRAPHWTPRLKRVFQSFWQRPVSSVSRSLQHGEDWRRSGAYVQKTTPKFYHPRPSADAVEKVKKFVILAVSRSGSTWLADLLDSHPDIVCYDEILSPWPDTAGNSVIRHIKMDGQESFFDYLDGVYGDTEAVAVGYKQVDKLSLMCRRTEEWKRYIVERNVSLICLTRRNLLNSVISSLAIAHGGYVHYLEPQRVDRARIHTSASDILDLMCKRFSRTEKLYKLFAPEGPPRLNVTYEQLLNEEGILDIIQDFLGVERRSLSSKLLKGNPYKQSDMLVHYDELAELIRRHEPDWEWMLTG